MRRLLFIIPAYNESGMIGQVLDSFPKKFKGIDKSDILVIDDGSDDNTYEIASKRKVRVLKHTLNRGLGAALATGFHYARIKSYDYVITFDADGQHFWRDAQIIIDSLRKTDADIVIGSRWLTSKNLPTARRLVNLVSNWITFLLFSIRSTDSQSGLRGFKKSTIHNIRIKSQRMEASSEIFKEINRLRLKVVEVPVNSQYTNYSLKKGQKLSNAPNVFWKLLLQRFS